MNIPNAIQVYFFQMKRMKKHLSNIKLDKNGDWKPFIIKT